MVLIILGFGWSQAALADGERWGRLADPIVHHLGVENGLPHPVVDSIEEDKDGFIWVGGVSLARWDGYRFKGYRPNRDDPHALPDNIIDAIHRDRKGRLWIGTESGGLVRYEPSDDGFRRLDAASDALNYGKIASIADDPSGILWVGTDRGLFRVDIEAGTFEQYRHDEHDGRSLPNDAITALTFDRDGVLWVGTEGGLARHDPATNRFAAAALPGANDSAAVACLTVDGAGQLWVGTDHHGAYLLKPGENAAKPILGPTLASSAIASIKEIAPGQIWLGVVEQGILIVDAAGHQVRHVRHDARPGSLSSDQAWVFYRDRAGLIWIGTSQGVDRIDALDPVILTLYGGPGSPDGLSQGDVRSVMVAADGRIWLGTRDNGIDIVDPGGSPPTAIRPDPDHPDAALPRALVRTLAQGADGSIFVGTEVGLYRISADRRHVAKLPFAGSALIAAIHIAGDTLWVGGREGLWRYDLASARAVRHWGSAELTDPSISDIAPAHAGGLWIGTAKGLDHLDIETGAVEKIGSLAEQKDAPSTDSRPITLLTDGQGRLWIGLAKEGIALWDGTDAQGRPRLRRFGLAEGLPSLTIDKLLMDKSGRVWVSTDDGFAVIEPKSLAVRAFRRDDGVASPTYWIDSGAVTDEGELLFGGTEGLSIVRPDRMQPWDFHPPVVITDLRIGGRTQAWVEEGGAPKTVTLSPGADAIAVEFSALDFSQPERNLYAYRLEGFDKEWVQTDASRRLAVYNNLAPGDYTLRIKGSNRDGVWSESALAVPIHVLPAWFQSWWFRAAVTLIAALGVLGIVRSRTAYLRSRQEILERQVAEKTEALASAARRADALLENILPRHVIEELTATGTVRPARHDSASVLFTDLAGFTLAAATMPADRMVSELNDIFVAFDEIAHEAGLEKIKTIGDAYMAVCGLSSEMTDHAQRCVRAGLRMQEFMTRRNQDSAFKWQLRVGIHSGPVVSGVVGKRKYAFDIWGDSVNMAARMESAGEIGRVNISAYTFDLIRKDYACLYRGKLSAKGKGEVDMYFVEHESAGAMAG